MGWANSVILQHGWQPKSTFRHPADIEVVPNWYSFFDHLRKVATPVHPTTERPHQTPNPLTQPESEVYDRRPPGYPLQGEPVNRDSDFTPRDGDRGLMTAKLTREG
jgi:hypothetical protein